MDVPHMHVHDWVGLIVAILVVWAVYRAQRNEAFKEFNVFDLFMENGRLSRIACMVLTTWGVVTWFIIKLIMTDKMTESYLTIYLGATFAPMIAKLLSSNSNSNAATPPTGG